MVGLRKKREKEKKMNEKRDSFLLVLFASSTLFSSSVSSSYSCKLCTFLDRRGTEQGKNRAEKEGWGGGSWWLLG